MKLEIEMDYKKSTKNTHVYADIKEGSSVPTIYIKRDDMPSDAPKQIMLTIEWND